LRLDVLLDAGQFDRAGGQPPVEQAEPKTDRRQEANKDLQRQ
jgi:hypothetical protein